MRIDMLYFDGCPSWKGAMENLQAALSSEGREADIRLVEVADDEEAARLKFLGSPSFQVDGVDCWPELRSRYYLSCRVYNTPRSIRGEPTVEMLREKIRSFSK
ncbi:MAG: hypothetical protein A3K46_02555 [Chloroflexi bacterium RBG_13_60_9]|nr:MAG: hypothetical protein A3K46_02555 [Chloroflexi bacterium RBG_13_60_9]